MAGIAGIFKQGQKDFVNRMLDIISHRGPHGKELLDNEGATIGIVYEKHEESRLRENLTKRILCDGPGFGHQVKVEQKNGVWQISRDELGVAPVYYTHTPEGTLCFASEVKALVAVSGKVSEVPPGVVMTSRNLNQQFTLKPKPALEQPPEIIADELLRLLKTVVSRRITSDKMGAWLSGGLDSSLICAIASRGPGTLHTFAGGMKGAPDLGFAREVASHIGSEHHEIIIGFDQMLEVLPRVIYHLESFDPLLVRSSIINFLVAGFASGYVEEVFTGEGGDEFFAGYHYLKEIPENRLEKELIDITSRLHNTALQRVDRCATAHGMTAHAIFTDPLLFEYVLSIPCRYKLKEGIEKWILRKAVQDLLPETIVWRPKEKFWEGAGVQSMLEDYAMKNIKDSDFHAERKLPNGWILNSKEELMYYRLFKESLGELENLDWMGRTKVT